MTRDEAKYIIRIIKESYPNWNPENLSDTIDIWATVLADESFEAIKFGLLNYIKSDTKGFAPSIGQIRNSANVVLSHDYDDTEEMIALVRKAVKNGSYGSQMEYDALPPMLQRAVGSPENIKAWALIDSQEFENVQLSHIRRSYRAIKENEKQKSRLKPIDSERLLEIQNKAMRIGTLPFSEE